MEVLREAGRGVDAATLERCRKAIARMPHRTIWEEIKRQRVDMPELEELFAGLPPAVLAW